MALLKEALLLFGESLGVILFQKEGMILSLNLFRKNQEDK